MTATKICDADARAILGDSYPKFAFHRGQMTAADRGDPGFGSGQSGLRGLLQMFDSHANDPRASDAQRAECIRARDFIAGTLAGLKGVAR